MVFPAHSSGLLGATGMWSKGVHAAPRCVAVCGYHSSLPDPASHACLEAASSPPPQDIYISDLLSHPLTQGGASASLRASYGPSVFGHLLM